MDYIIAILIVLFFVVLIKIMLFISKLPYNGKEKSWGEKSAIDVMMGD